MVEIENLAKVGMFTLLFLGAGAGFGVEEWDGIDVYYFVEFSN